MKRLLIGIIFVLVLAGCTISPDTEAAIRDAIAANAGHMKDEGLPAPAREIATDNHDLLWDILYREGCVDELPADVRARKDARSSDGGSR